MLKKVKYVIICVIVLIIMYVTTVFAYYSYNTSNIETINGTRYWTGFKSYHYGFVHPAYAYSAEDVPFSYTYTYIDATGATHQSVSSGNDRAIGYGAYAMDYRNHVLGLLYYIKGHMSETDNYRTAFTKLKSSDPNLEPIEEQVKMKEACSIVAEGITLSSYGNKYKNETFNDFWHKSFIADKESVLLKYENGFYAQLFAENAISYLENFGLNTSDSDIIPSGISPAINGAIFSIVEGRYRNKNIGGKTNQMLKVSAGEVLPFLIYFDCEYSDDSNGNRTYTNIVPPRTSDGKLNIDKIIDGAYQYMVYYFDIEGVKTSKRTALSVVDTSEEDGESELDFDYIGEYEDLTKKRFPYLRGKELESFLEKVSEKSAIYKKSRENSYGTFGVDEEYSIESYVNFSEAMSDMRTAIESTIGSEAFAGMQGEENIARTYLMAKNIVDSYKDRDELSYYDIGTNVILKTPGLDGNVYLLTDFQKVELVSPLLEKDSEQNTRRTYEDTDDDGIYDRNEMPSTRDIEITEFVRKTLYNDLYGKDPEDISASEKRNRDNHIESVLNQYKQKVKADFVTKRSNNEDEYEFYCTNDGKLVVTAYTYRSNPTLKDTDFDGIDDGKGGEELEKKLIEKGDQKALITYEMLQNDVEPLSNHFIGRMNSTRLSGSEAIEVDMNMDYRYFLMSNKNYYDELSTMSLLYANSIYRKGAGQEMHSGLTIFNDNNLCTMEDRDNGIEYMSHNGKDYKNLRVKEMMEHFGFQNVKTYYLGKRGDGTDNDPADGFDECRGYTDTHKGAVALGYSEIIWTRFIIAILGSVRNNMCNWLKGTSIMLRQA